jgi:glycosyltransferase involved in cell wall biosynthesis
VTKERSTFVSVVIPTRNRAETLRQLLATLERQDHPPSQVIVVDDASHDSTKEVLARWQSKGRIAIYLDHPRGSYSARNVGWKHADAEIVAFTDDDCLPEPQWLSELVKKLRSEEVVAVQGVVLTERSQSSPFTHQIEQLSAGPPYRTCNMAYRRQVLQRIGGFDESLRWYGDNILGWQAKQLGNIAFAPNAVVHHPPRAREWRNRRAWLERFHADAKHRSELFRLKAEPIVLPRKVLPLALWVLRPLIKQSYFHLMYFLANPQSYTQGIWPLLREKWQMMLALRDFWRGEDSVSANDDHSRVTPRLPLLIDDTKVSVIVVTKNRPQLLEGTLQALNAQTWSRQEVVVVDHGGNTETRAVALRSGAKYVVANGSLAAARQTGVDSSSGEIVAFTDDDCLPDREWLEALVGSLGTDRNLLGVQGRTVAENGPIGSHTVQVSRPNSLYQTCNIAYRRKVLDAVGGFDLEFDGWFEDTALGARVLAKGDIGFQPNAVVLHRSVPRCTFGRNDWTRLLKDELTLSKRYSAFYGKTRGRSFLLTVFRRWMVGSALKALVGEAPKAMRNPRSYLTLVGLVMRERKELFAALFNHLRLEAKSKESAQQESLRTR